MPPCFF